MKVLRYILAGMLFVAVSAVAQAKVFTVGLSWNALDNQFPVKSQEYMESQGRIQGAKAGITFKWITNVANGDPTRQASNIEDLIDQGVDLIIARAADAKAIGASIRAAQRAGIPFMAYDRESASTRPTVFVGGDSYDEAKTTAVAFLALLKSKGIHGECIELEGALTDINAINRHKAWHAITDHSGIITTVEVVPTNWDPSLFRSGTVNAFRAHPNANCLFIGSDFAWPAVQSALESLGRLAKTGSPKHVWIATQDLFPAAVKAMEEGYIDVGTTYDAYGMAKEAIREAIRIAKHEPINCPNKICLVPGRVVTQQTVRSLPNLWSRPSD